MRALPAALWLAVSCALGHPAEARMPSGHHPGVHSHPGTLSSAHPRLLLNPRTSSTTCAPANYKTLTQIMTEFRTCSDQGLGLGCITQGNVQDLICSARKLTSGDFVTVAPSGATYTPDFNTGVNFSITLSASCPCTLANPSNQTNQSGLLEIVQDTTGGRTIGTYGTNYLASSVPTLSTTANAKDYVSYAVNPSGKIIFGSPVLNAH